ncbi:hypothetical protein T02_5075 [Trichinella nativa]|uniref:Uncharacterized protein n=1 Tax=Trichinella nativa TaxID=6335 RepID=A0A0V1L2R5_9BILA|nr:hypothetical protein T02_5075 [Trichinella nativa]
MDEERKVTSELDKQLNSSSTFILAVFRKEAKFRKVQLGLVEWSVKRSFGLRTMRTICETVTGHSSVKMSARMDRVAILMINLMNW